MGDAFGNVLDFGDFTDVLGNLTGDYDKLFDQDPFLSDNTTNSWPTNGETGLTLKMYNALDDTWQDEFDAAISDWENGDPDALTHNRQLGSSRTPKSPMLTPEWRAEYDLAINKLEQVKRDPDNSDSQWRLLRDHSRGGDYVRKLGEKYTLQVHMFYAMPI